MNVLTTSKPVIHVIFSFVLLQLTGSPEVLTAESTMEGQGLLHMYNARGEGTRVKEYKC